MSVAVVPFAAPLRRHSLLLFLGASLLLHGLGLLLAARARLPAAASRPRPSELVVVEVEPPKEHPPEPPPKTEPRLRPKLSVVAPRKPARAEAPPPNDTPPPVGPPPPVVVGLTLESTTTASAVAVPVGNTLAGKPAEQAVAPSSVRPGYAPLYLVDTPPELLEAIGGEEIYPKQAKKLGIEGQVVLAITVEVDGHVSAAQVVSGPGYGLNEAARGAVLRARFKPATKGGKPVATDLRYSYIFALNQ
ncbi:MAG: energy transducer TonB [Myxococcaceae bacterium]